VRKSRGVDFKVQDNSKLDCVVEASILTKQGLKGHPGQETARYGADFVRKIGRSSLLNLVITHISHLLWGMGAVQQMPAWRR
jgi:inosine/xanthosine triphosphate pyrophosphatase family protein